MVYFLRKNVLYLWRSLLIERKCQLKLQNMVVVALLKSVRGVIGVAIVSRSCDVHGRSHYPPPPPLPSPAGGWTESGGAEGGAAPPKPRRMMDFAGGDDGAADATAVAGRARAKRDADEVVQEESVAIIRDGDDLADAAAALERAVADAPRNAGGRRVATLAELDGDNASGMGALNASVSLAAGVDLSLLTASLYPPSALVEADQVWDAGYLLQRITQEMHAEVDKRDKAAAEDGVSPAAPAPTTTGSATAGPTSGGATNANTTSAAGRTRAAA